jgi:hypothetical protein
MRGGGTRAMVACVLFVFLDKRCSGGGDGDGDVVCVVDGGV